MSSSECIRPPTETTLASLCSRARTAVSADHASAQRMPTTLLAAICSPLPDPPITTPRLSSPAARSAATPSRGAQAEDRVVVEGVVDERAVVDRLVAVVGEPVAEVVLQLEAGMVAAEVHAHARSLSERRRVPQATTARSGASSS